jgi:hypothetical protein
MQLPDDGPCETETCNSEARLIININLEVFVVVTVIVSLLHIVIHNRMHTVKKGKASSVCFGILSLGLEGSYCDFCRELYVYDV